MLSTLAALPIAIALIAMTLNGTGAVATADHTASDYEYVTVHAGQTLWELALELNPNADPRDTIYDVLALNQLSSTQIYPGQRLAIPATYTTNN